MPSRAAVGTSGCAGRGGGVAGERADPLLRAAAWAKHLRRFRVYVGLGDEVHKLAVEHLSKALKQIDRRIFLAALQAANV